MLSRRLLNRTKMLAFLEELGKAPAAGTQSFYLPPDEAVNVLTEIPPEIAEAAAKSPNGAVLFRSPDAGYLVLPPFPIRERVAAAGFFTEPLKSLLEHNYKIALVLVRLGSYAIGLSQGEKLVSSKVGTGNIHGRHRQGGSSAHRFERHRDKQIETFLNRVGGHILEHLRPQEKALDYIVYGGAWRTIQLLRKYCPFLERLPTPVLPPLLDIPEPRQPMLESAIKRVWSSTVLGWRKDDNLPTSP